MNDHVEMQNQGKMCQFLTLREDDTEYFKLSMKLSVNFDLKYIEILVSIKNKEKCTKRTKIFSPQDFSEALDYYDHLKEFFI